MQRATSKNARTAFVQSIGDAQAQSLPFSQPPGTNPHLYRMNWFAQASAIGPAIYYADAALKNLALQPTLRNGPGIFGRGKLREEGWLNRKSELPPLAPQEIPYVKRQRALLLLDGQRYSTLEAEAKKQPDSDAVVIAVYGAAFARKRDMSAVGFFDRARAAEPSTPLIIAGNAWSMALQGRQQDARNSIGYLLNTPRPGGLDRHSLLFLGYAAEAMGDLSQALDLYQRSAALARGYFEGSVACTQAMAVAMRMDVTSALRTAQNLTQSLPVTREAWQGLRDAAQRAGNPALARQAQEQLALMQGVTIK